MKAAVIDVGYNSLKMVKYRIEPDGSPRFYGQLGMMARLGEGLEWTGYLGKAQVARTVDALKLCREAASLEGIKHVLLVGTSPVREAANREEFLRHVQEETGLRMRVLTGNEEALYGFLGAARSVGAPSALYFDLGGGSLEITYAERSKIRRIASLPLGALKLTSLYAGKDGRFSRKSRGKMGKRILQLLPSRRELDLDEEAVLVGTGGTVRALARLEQDRVDYPINKIHNYTIDHESVEQMSREVLQLRLDELGRMDSIGEDRAGSVAAGAFVVRLMMRKLGFDQLTVSTHGLRDGILAEFLERGLRAPQEVARKDEVERMLVPPEVPARLAGNSELTDCLIRNGVIDKRQGGLLMTALQRGRSEDWSDADPEALFGIEMSEDLPMRHSDQVFMAISLVRARRPRTANWLQRRYGSMMLQGDSKAVRKMGACLRLMETLDRSSAQFRVSYSGALRIALMEGEDPVPIGLIRNSALALSAAVKRPVAVVVPEKAKRGKAQPLRVRG